MFVLKRDQFWHEWSVQMKSRQIESRGRRWSVITRTVWKEPDHKCFDWFCNPASPARNLSGQCKSMGDVRCVVPSISSAVSALEGRNGINSLLWNILGYIEEIKGQDGRIRKRKPTKLYRHIVLEKQNKRKKTQHKQRLISYLSICDYSSLHLNKTMTWSCCALDAMTHT